jgi:hypothetical protein
VVTKKLLYKIIKILISCGLIFIILRNIDFANLSKIITEANKFLLVSAFLLAVFDNGLISAYKWRKILLSYNINLPFAKVCSYYFIGMFFNMFMPGIVGSDLIRGYYISCENNSKIESYISVIIDRLSGILGLFINSIIAIFLASRFEIKLPATNLILSLFFLFLFSVWLIYNRELWNRFRLLHVITTKLKVGDTVKKFYEAMYNYRYKKKLVVYIVFLAFLFQFLVVVTNYVVALAVGLRINFIYFWVLIPLICLVSMIPISINGIGLRDISYITCFATIGVSTSYAFSMSLIIWGIGIGMGLIGGLIYTLTSVPFHSSP